MTNKQAPAGILLVDKESGPTSHDLVGSLRRLLHMRRIGHCGTLDPLATGLMVMCVGRYTRLNPWLSGADKVYEAQLHLGATSNTEDSEGVITQSTVERKPQVDEIEQILTNFLGEVDQVPPTFSAIKIDGVRSHKLARAGKAKPLEPRRVRISQLVVRSYIYPKLELTVHCSKGTYIRALARDIGSALGCGAYLSALRRTAVGPMRVEDALTVGQIEAIVESGQLPSAFYSTRSALTVLDAVDLDQEGQVLRFGHGNAIELEAKTQDGECAVYHPDGYLFGMGRIEAGQLKPTMVLVDTPSLGS